MVDPRLEDVRWTESPNEVGVFIINELKSMGVVVQRPQLVFVYDT